MNAARFAGRGLRVVSLGLALGLALACTDYRGTPSEEPDVDCRSDGRRCDGDRLVTCAGGARVREEDCVGLGLVCGTPAGGALPRCIAPACDEGALRCAEAVLERCSAGAWALEEDCGLSARFCSADGGTPACIAGCVEGARWCERYGVFACVDGLGTVQEDCLAPGLVCVQEPENGASCALPGPTCEPYQEDVGYCDGDRLLLCAGGEWVLDEDCAASGLSCIHYLGGGPRCGCEQDAKACEGDLLMACELGHWQLEEDCAATGTSCVPVPEGEPYCGTP